MSCFPWYKVWLSFPLMLDLHFRSSEQKHDCCCSFWSPRSVLTTFPKKLYCLLLQSQPWTTWQFQL